MYLSHWSEWIILIQLTTLISLDLNLREYFVWNVSPADTLGHVCRWASQFHSWKRQSSGRVGCHRQPSTAFYLSCSFFLRSTCFPTSGWRKKTGTYMLIIDICSFMVYALKSLGWEPGATDVTEIKEYQFLCFCCRRKMISEIKP